MLGVGEILGNFAVLVVGQGQLVVLRTVNNMLLDGCVHIAEAQRSGGSAKGLHHLNAGGALLHADLQTFQVIGGINGGSCIEIAGTGIIPGHHAETGFIGGIIHVFHVIGIIHDGMVSFF